MNVLTRNKFPTWRVCKMVPDMCPYTYEPTEELRVEEEFYTPTDAESQKLLMEAKDPLGKYLVEESFTWM